MSSQYCETPVPVVQLKMTEEPGKMDPGKGLVICPFCAAIGCTVTVTELMTAPPVPLQLSV